MCIFCVLASNNLTYIESECKKLVKSYMRTRLKKKCLEMSFCRASAGSPGESFMLPSNWFLKCKLVYQLERLCPFCARITRITYLKQDNMTLSSSSSATATTRHWKCHCASEQTPTGSLSPCMFRSIALSPFLVCQAKIQWISQTSWIREYHNQHRNMLDL